ncbi:MAG: tRNA guanosine(34) transglycosylase Tgt [Planctomyces sp.]|nr:tRNA guanosine(34) transglycosylase Tgt [Planctomyces sp.]MBA4119112.1 tRNA guanosine(34) transglycosylase Tgt [Isosphaera sp.]
MEITARSRRGAARAGRVITPHGAFPTPAFMPVGTRGSVKGITPELLARCGAGVCLANTYHLLLRPGAQTIAELGGVHTVMGWPRPVLTDSGGYQAYSMADINRVTDDGVWFRSIVDGSEVTLGPESATRAQNLIGADIIMAFDDCPPPLTGPVGGDAGAGDGAAADPRLARAVRRDAGARGRMDPAERLAVANRRTVAWLERCIAAHDRADQQGLFGIVQGGTDPEARTWCAARVCGYDLPGYAIGGVAVGESPEDIARVVRHTAGLLPADRPRYLMGVGYERDILAAVLAGVDMFDCVLPTRNGRNATAFTPAGRLRLRNAEHARDTRPIQEGCRCPACRGWAGADGERFGPFSRGALRHLFMSGEMLGPIMVTAHNLAHFQALMADVRQTVASDDWEGLAARWPVAAPGLDGAGLGPRCDGGAGGQARRA